MTPIANPPSPGQFVDPRTNPSPGGPRVPVRLTTETAEFVELHRSAVWAASTMSSVGSGPDDRFSSPPELSRGATTPQSALEIALDRQDHSLILLLVANGYDLTLEPECPLDTALRMRRGDLLDLLMAWGADPRRVDLDILLETYDSQLFERFRDSGSISPQGHAMAYALGYHTSNKPLLGFARRHRLDEPRIQTGARHRARSPRGRGPREGRDALPLGRREPSRPGSATWLHGIRRRGAGGRRPAQRIQAAVQRWARRRSSNARAEPSRDDYEELYLLGRQRESDRGSARSALPKDSGSVIALQLARTNLPFHDHRPVEALRALFAAGVRWQTSPVEEIASARRDLLRCSDYHFADLMKLLATDDHCSREVLTELARTPSMRERMKKVGLIPATPRAPEARSTGSGPPSTRNARQAWGRATEAEGDQGLRSSLSTERIRRWRRDGLELRARSLDPLRARLDRAGRDAGQGVGPVRPRARQGLQAASDSRSAARILGKGGSWSATAPPASSGVFRRGRPKRFSSTRHGRRAPNRRQLRSVTVSSVSGAGPRGLRMAPVEGPCRRDEPAPPGSSR